MKPNHFDTTLGMTLQIKLMSSDLFIATCEHPKIYKGLMVTGHSFEELCSNIPIVISALDQAIKETNNGDS